jgi:hypothetical protein
MTVTGLGYIIILTEYAFQVAKAEKDRSGTASSNEHRFLPKVGRYRGHHSLSTGPAGPQFFGASVDTASPGAEITVMHFVKQFCNNIVEFSLFV